MGQPPPTPSPDDHHQDPGSPWPTPLHPTSTLFLSHRSSPKVQLPYPILALVFTPHIPWTTDPFTIPLYLQYMKIRERVLRRCLWSNIQARSWDLIQWLLFSSSLTGTFYSVRWCFSFLYSSVLPRLMGSSDHHKVSGPRGSHRMNRTHFPVALRKDPKPSELPLWPRRAPMHPPHSPLLAQIIVSNLQSTHEPNFLTMVTSHKWWLLLHEGS